MQWTNIAAVAVAAALAGGCAAPDNAPPVTPENFRAGYVRAKSDSLDPATARQIRDGKISVGMESEHLLMAWGSPHHRNHSSHGPDQWVYGTVDAYGFRPNAYVYVDDGRVVSWQTVGY